jgi:hypothetical protein
MPYFAKDNEIFELLEYCHHSEWVSSSQREYLIKLECLMNKWSRESKVKDRSYNLITTSRVESMNNRLKNSLNSKVGLVEFRTRIIKFDTETSDNDQLDLPPSQRKLMDKQVYIEELKKSYSQYSIRRMINAMLDSINFRAVESRAKQIYSVSSRDGELSFTVKYNERKKFVCACEESFSWGLPCSHIWAAKLLAGTKGIRDMDIHPHWLKFKPQMSDDNLITALHEFQEFGLNINFGTY